MKKIALCATDLSLQSDHAEIQFIIETLSQQHTEIKIFNLEKEIFPSSDEYDGIILVFNQSPKKIDEFTKLVLELYQKSKPIAAIQNSALHAATVLKKHRPLITLGLSSEFDLHCQKLNIQIEHCPSNDYISDRECKILSTPGKNNSASNATEIKMGLKLLLKEFVEIA